MKRIFAFALIFIMVFTVNAFADDYDLLSENYTSYEANTSITVDLGNSAQLLSSVARSFGNGMIDYDLLFSTLNKLECSGKVKLDANDDYSKMSVMYEIKTTVPFQANRNLKITSEVMYSMWMNWDITNPAEPKLEYIYSVPFQNKYFVADYFNMPGMSENDKADLVSVMKRTFNKKYIETVSKEMVKSYRDNSKLVVRGNKSIITFGRQGMNSVVADAVDIIAKSMGDNSEYAELAESAAVMPFPTAEQTADFLNKYNVFADEAMVMEITKTSGGALSAANIKVNFEFDIAKYAADNNIELAAGTPNVLNLGVSAYTEYSNLNKKVDIEMPEINDENSVKPFDYPMIDYDWGGENCRHNEYMYFQCDYITAADGTCYVSLDEYKKAAYRLGYDYAIDNNGGKITLTDKNAKEAFGSVGMTVNSYDIYIDGAQRIILNPVLDVNGEIYVDTEAIKYIFNADLCNMFVDMDTNIGNVSFTRRSPQCPHDENYYYEYDENDDVEPYYCRHYQSGYINSYMPYAGTKYVALEDIADLLYREYSISSGYGVTTLTVDGGEDKFATLCFGEGNTDMTVDGVWTVAEEPTVMYNDILYISVDTAKRIFGFEVSDESLDFRMANEFEMMLPSGMYYSAYFERRNPVCNHSEEEIARG